MKPKPLEALNHFTVPCSFTCQPHMRNSDRVGIVDIGIAVRLLARSWELQHGFPSVAKSFHPKKKATKIVLAAPSNESKGITRATNASKRVPQSAQFVHSYEQGMETYFHSL